MPLSDDAARGIFTAEGAAWCTLARMRWSPGDGRSRFLVALGRSVALALALVECAGGEADVAENKVDPLGCGDSSKALSRCLKPARPPAYYVEQSMRYFDTLDVSVSPAVGPLYSELAARWEWPPWLKLTGYGGKMMEETASLVTTRDPSTIPTRDCRAFDVQPFGRCYVTFVYDGGPCAIYEEFSFNDQGEMTFLEAWTNAPALLPMDGAVDPWAEGPAVRRLSTRIPGLGSASGRIDPDSAAMQAAASADPDVADFAVRARDFWGTWLAELKENGKDIYARGCGW